MALSNIPCGAPAPDRPGTERASASPFGPDSDTESGTMNGEKRGVKRKESPLRKSLGKRMKLSAADFPGRISVPTREPVNSSPLRSSSPIREASPDVSPSLVGMFANKTIPTIPLVEDFIDIDGDADALGSEEDDLSHD
ncbi:hypothetical protein SpCBS45565_g01375 [Spizellomyces sp. 'palustris']|nr:hypothetical protein SpCBS45565_g01375 [Spizellomyces sp. 'palustris']